MDHQASSVPDPGWAGPVDQLPFQWRERAAAPAGGAPAAAEARRVAWLNFVGRLARLDLAAVRGAVEAWRHALREDADAWFAAEEAVAAAVAASGRRDEQKPLLLHVAEAFAYAVWYRGGEVEAPETRVRSTEASGQYLATLAALALLVRDRLGAREFAVLYGPFASLIPADEVWPE